MMGLREGKNREIRRVCESLGLIVNRLIRVSYGPFQLGDLQPGAVEEIPSRYLRDQLGLRNQDGEDDQKKVPAKGSGRPRNNRNRNPKQSPSAPRRKR